MGLRSKRPVPPAASDPVASIPKPPVEIIPEDRSEVLSPGEELYRDVTMIEIGICLGMSLALVLFALAKPRR